MIIIIILRCDWPVLQQPAQPHPHPQIEIYDDNLSVFVRNEHNYTI